MLNYVSVCVERIWVADFIWHVEWDVRHRVGQIKEERFVLIAFDELDRLVGISPGDGPLIDWHFEDFVVLH